MAYARLGTIYNNFGQVKTSETYRNKAFELKDRASEREKLYISAHYYADSGQLEKGNAAYELYKQTYKRDVTPYINLGVTYLQLGEFEKVLEISQEAMRVEPDEERGYANAGIAYAALNRLDEAKAVVSQGLQRHPEFASLHDILATIALAQGDIGTMEREESLAKAQPDLEWSTDVRHGDLAASRGQLRNAEEFFEKARQVGQKVESKSAEALALAERAWVQALSGRRKEAPKSASEALRILDDYNLKLSAAVTLAFAGENKKALDLAEEVAKSRSQDVIVQSLSVPSVRGCAALSGGDAAKAIELLKPAEGYDKNNLQVLYIRGLAFMKAGHGTEAAQEFQKILALRSVWPADPLMSLAHLGLGRAFALQGDSQKSRTAYQDFFALWKDADSDLPLLKEAKAEYEKLL